MTAPAGSSPEKTPPNNVSSPGSTTSDDRGDAIADKIPKQTGKDIDHIEDGEKSAKYNKYLEAGLSDEDASFLVSFSAKEERAIFRKVDWRVVPMLATLYLISHLDRANIGNAKIEGLEDSLGMSGSDYNIAVSMFFIPYILCEVPSNMLLAKFSKPSRYIGILVTSWGTIVTLSGLVQNLAGLAVFPGAIYLLSTWYPPYKTQSRTALFYLSSAASGAFSGLLAAAIAQLDGVGGLRGWRWIFILEGIISVAFGISAFFLLPDTPSLSGRWLTEPEQRYLNLIHYATRGTGAAKTSSGVADPEGEGKKRFNWKVMKQILTDRHLYLQALIFASNTIPNNGMKFTMPQIIRNMGYKSTNAQLLSAPPYLAGAAATVLSSLWADRRSWRMPPIVFFQSLVLISMSVLFAFAPRISDNIALCYTMVVISCIGMYPIIPANNAWTVNNLAGPEKRVAGIAFMVTMGNTGAFVGSWVFLDNESPQYPTGFGTCLAIAATGMVAALSLEWLYNRHNKRWEGYSREEIRGMYSEEQLQSLGDRSPLFKYGL